MMQWWICLVGLIYSPLWVSYGKYIFGWNFYYLLSHFLFQIVKNTESVEASQTTLWLKCSSAFNPIVASRYRLATEVTVQKFDVFHAYSWNVWLYGYICRRLHVVLLCLATYEWTCSMHQCMTSSQYNHTIILFEHSFTVNVTVYVHVKF